MLPCQQRSAIFCSTSEYPLNDLQKQQERIAALEQEIIELQAILG